MSVKRSIACLLVFFAIYTHLSAETRTVVLGEDDGWRDVLTAENIALVDGKRGYLDIVIRDGGYITNSNTDMLLDFDESFGDKANKYLLVSNEAIIHPRASQRGNGGAVFDRTDSSLVYQPLGSSILSANKSWSDFSIEFWLYPALLDEGATILQWSGARNHTDSLLLENIDVVLSNRRLVWTFTNVFLPPDLSSFTLRLQGDNVLVPRRWHHHLLRHSGDTGLTEYLIDGELVDIIHTTGSGRESSEVYTSYSGDSQDTYVTLGTGFTGFIDEVRIQASFVEYPSLERYPVASSSVTTRAFDLDYTNTRLTSIDADYTEERNSTALFYYRIGEFLTSSFAVDAEWIPFRPGEAFADDDRGRYLQLKVELLPDGEREVSPKLHTMSVSFEPDLPPHPPEQIRVSAGNGQVGVSWNRSLDADVAGYLLYYGSRSMWYYGDDAIEGTSPIDVGNIDSYTITGLANGSLYYIALVAYDSSVPPHQSEFSLEKSARPTRVFGDD